MTEIRDMAQVLRDLRHDLDTLQGALRRRAGVQSLIEHKLVEAGLVTEQELTEAEQHGGSP